MTTELTPIRGDDLIWLGNSAKRYEGSLANLAGRLPEFERRPFSTRELDNPRADLIVYTPTAKAGERPMPVPVAMVSKSYELIQHLQVIENLFTALREHEFFPETLPGCLILTEYGERIYLRVILPGHEYLPRDRHPLAIELHLWNSVDRSLALQLRLGWYRLVCANGLYLGIESARARRVHTVLQKPLDLPDLLADQLEALPEAQGHLRTWETTAVDLSRVEAWADESVYGRWGTTAAARVSHIARSGRDGDVQITSAAMKPHQRPLRNELPVPGAQAPARNVYDVAQALAWVARQSPTVQDQLDRRRDIGPLIQNLIDSLSARS